MAFDLLDPDDWKVWWRAVGTKEESLEEKGFDTWYVEKRGPQHDIAFFAAKAAWEAGRRALLDPSGKDVAQQAAIEVLKGNEGDLAVAIDWLMEREGWEAAEKKRFSLILSLLKRACDQFDQFKYSHRLSEEIRKALGRPSKLHTGTQWVDDPSNPVGGVVIEQEDGSVTTEPFPD